MSLINEALKRARQAQQQEAPPPASNLQLRPIEPAQYTRRSPALMVLAALAVVALLLLLVLWQKAPPNAAPPGPGAQPRAALPAAPTIAPQPAPAPNAAAPASQPIPGTPPARPAPETVSPATPLKAAAASSPAEPAPTVAPDTGATHVALASEAPAPKPATPKLQAIIFSSVRPSIMIAGKTLFIGDTLDGLCVTAISKESATLVGMGQTNVLTLPR